MEHKKVINTCHLCSIRSGASAIACKKENSPTANLEPLGSFLYLKYVIVGDFLMTV